MCGENPFRGDEREIRKMLVIDGVKLIFVHQPEQVGKLHGNDAAGFEKDLHSLDEVIEVRNLGQDVVPQKEIGALTGRYELPRQFLVEEADQRGYVLFQGHPRDVCGRFDTEDGNLLIQEILQKIPVVAGELDHQTVCAQTEAMRNLIGVLLGVIQPRVRIRRKIGVLSEDVLRPDVLLELNEKAITANKDAERIERLHLVDPVLGQKAFTKR